MIHYFHVLVLFYTCVNASPIALPQAVTAVVSPPQPPPPGCTGAFPGVFGIALMNISLPSSTSASGSESESESGPESIPAGRLRGRQQAPTPIFTMGSVSQIGDGQVQGGMHTDTVVVVTPLAPVSQIGDGQIQGPVVTVEPDVVTDIVLPTTSVTGVAPTANVPIPFPPQAQGSNSPATPNKPPTVLEQACGISTRPLFNPTPTLPSPSLPSTQPSTPAAQISSTTSTPFNATTTTVTPAASSYTSPTPPPSLSPSPSPSPRLSLVSCLTNSTLRLHLTANNLYDAFNRTGYIASNYQFQFDGPPQSGAIWTSGWSICPVVNNDDGDDDGNGNGNSNGDDSDDGIRTLALGGSTTFWQCLSGDFYNLYTENWAAQCSPVQLRVVSLVECSQ